MIARSSEHMCANNRISENQIGIVGLMKTSFSLFIRITSRNSRAALSTKGSATSTGFEQSELSGCGSESSIAWWLSRIITLDKRDRSPESTIFWMQDGRGSSRAFAREATGRGQPESEVKFGGRVQVAFKYVTPVEGFGLNAHHVNHPEIDLFQPFLLSTTTFSAIFYNSSTAGRFREEYGFGAVSERNMDRKSETSCWAAQVSNAPPSDRLAESITVIICWGDFYNIGATGETIQLTAFLDLMWGNRWSDLHKVQTCQAADNPLDFSRCESPSLGSTRCSMQSACEYTGIYHTLISTLSKARRSEEALSMSVTILMVTIYLMYTGLSPVLARTRRMISGMLKVDIVHLCQFKTDALLAGQGRTDDVLPSGNGRQHGCWCSTSALPYA
ncbi:hypothetical protein FIBSPDRAFT_927308 [Athelia psychrophila]|uniref:Uncharacterized protein n=1 Tax=Athelia psychrophila TaxID=1759441 RepID=A0A166S1E8_9AGAM|nr:hypothetical protein FIBSPDRAFT_927308 [Fibularhizoctonia sp. CBS 109695]